MKITLKSITPDAELNIQAISYHNDWTDQVYEGFACSLIDSYIKQGQNLYNSLLDAGIAKECARMILPMATQTTIFMTGSIRSWIHFLDIRLDGHAQKEAQLIAQAIRDLFIDNMPIISAARGYAK